MHTKKYKIATPGGTEHVSGYVLPFEPALAIRYHSGEWQLDHIPTGYRIFVFRRLFVPTTTDTLGHFGKTPKKADVLRMLRAASIVPVPWHLITTENAGEYDELAAQYYEHLVCCYDE